LFLSEITARTQTAEEEGGGERQRLRKFN